MSKHSELAKEIVVELSNWEILSMEEKAKIVDERLSGVRGAVERCFVIRDTSPLVKIHESLKVD